MHGIDAEGFDHGQEDRRADQQHRRQIHERAERQQQNVDVKQKRVFVARDRDEKLRDLRRYAHDRHHVAEGDREADHDHDHADGTHDARDQLRHLAPLDVAVDEHRDGEGVNAGDRSGFGRREDAGQDAAQDDRDRDHAPDRIDGDLDRLTQRHDLASGELVPVSDDQNKNDQRQTKEQGWNDAAHEQVSYGDRPARGDRINDHVVRGRDEKRLQRARDRDIDREQARIAVLDHLRDHHRADRRSIGDGRARDATEHRGGDDVDERHSATNEADEHLSQVHEALGHTADGHDRAGEDEERNGQQREAAHPAGDFEHYRFKRDPGVECGENGGNAERICDGHAHQTDDGETTNENEDVHDPNPTSVYSVVS